MQTLREWLTGTALPLWAERGFATGPGRFEERLDADARPLTVPYRSMVQARQIFVYAHAATLGWHDGGALAETAMRSLRRDYVETAGDLASVAFSIDASGRVVSPVRDAYGHAFVLFAIAWLYRLNGDPALLDLADGLLRFIDRHLADPQHGGLFDQHPVGDRGKRQNPLMHLLEACLALDESAPGRGYLERARHLVVLFRRNLFASGHGALLEHFAEDWGDHPESHKRHVVEPGHHFEWVWLLRQYETRSGETMQEFIAALFAHACRHGLPDGVIVDEIAPDGRVLKASRRLWPHTEAIKGAAVRHADGDPTAAAFADAMASALRTHFLDRPFAGGWTDHRGAAGDALVDYVPASSLYHLTLAASEMERVFVPRA